MQLPEILNTAALNGALVMLGVAAVATGDHAAPSVSDGGLCALYVIFGLLPGAGS